MLALTTRLSLGIVAGFTGPLDLATSVNELNYPKLFQWASGTAANQADRVYHDQRTLTASATENLDLAGSLLDPFNNTITFARIKLLMVYAALGNTNLVQVGGAASNAFINWVANSSDIINVRPGGLLLLAAPDVTGYAVTAGTGDILKMTNSAGSTSVTYDIVLVGASA